MINRLIFEIKFFEIKTQSVLSQQRGAWKSDQISERITVLFYKTVKLSKNLREASPPTVEIYFATGSPKDFLRNTKMGIRSFLQHIQGIPDLYRSVDIIEEGQKHRE